MLNSETCLKRFSEELLTAPPGHLRAIQPKDFAFARGFIDPTSNQFALHMFYIRRSYYNIPADNNEKNLGHTWTTDFNSWHPIPTDTIALVVRPGKFDELHVWAPTIVQRGPVFHMFYTGVRNEGGRRNQRIGVATSTDLNTWTQEDAVVLSSPQVGWASRNPPSPFDGQQLRDPFVMPDPVHGGKWLMYFVAVDSVHFPQMAVGVATSSDLRSWTVVPKPFFGTERPTYPGAPASRIESPHLFARRGQWWMPYTVDGDTVFFETTASIDPADTTTFVTNSAHPGWTNPIWLRGVAEGRPNELQFWHATEHLLMQPGTATQPPVDYLAAWDDDEGFLDFMGIFAADQDSAAVDSFLLSCPGVSGVVERRLVPNDVQMSIAAHRWGTPNITVQLELPSALPVRLTVLDIAGRRRTTLVDGDLPRGTTQGRLGWPRRSWESRAQRHVLHPSHPRNGHESFQSGHAPVVELGDASGS
jgi:hypothetical protein